jgi:undecaprenyl-diphosphatase
MNLLIVFGASYLYIVIATIALFIFLRSDKKLQSSFVKLSLFSFPLSFVLAKISAYFITSPRPFVVEHIQPLVHASVDNGFPSDHTLLAMTIALTIFVYNKKVGSILVILAIIVGVARVLAHVHHVEDIGGSIVISIIASYGAYYLLRSFNIKLPILDS